MCAPVSQCQRQRAGIDPASAGSAAAQQPSQAQVNAIRAACRSDFQAHCPGVQPGGSAALACLKKNFAALSTGCQKAVGDVAGASAPAQKSSDTPAAPPPPAAASASAAALPAAAPASAPSAAAAAAPAPAAPAPRAGMPVGVELAVLRRACGGDVQANCPGVRPGGGQVIACLIPLECSRKLATERE
jgi:Cysteine rich repeat